MCFPQTYLLCPGPAWRGRVDDGEDIREVEHPESDPGGDCDPFALVEILHFMTEGFKCLVKIRRLHHRVV